MDIFNVLSLIGGLALFLYGMNVMGDGLAKTAGGKLEKILEKLTSTPIKGVYFRCCSNRSNSKFISYNCYGGRLC